MNKESIKIRANTSYGTLSISYLTYLFISNHTFIVHIFSFLTATRKIIFYIIKNPY